jgi:ankyrin repeat protein
MVEDCNNSETLQSMSTSVAECEVAMNDADMDDESLLRIFDACDDFNALLRPALLSNNARAVRLLLSSVHFDPSSTDEVEGTYLHNTFTWSNLQLIDMMLGAGLAVDATTVTGALPWHYAAENPDESVMTRLLATGIDVNAADARLWSLAHRAAARNENENILAMLIAAGASVTIRDIGGNTLCHGAALNPNAAVMALVIPLCDVNAVNNDGVSPCMWAVDEDNSAALALLIGAGANVNAVDNDGKSVGARALEQADEKVLELLVNADVDLTTVDPDDGANVLRLAVAWCNHRLVAKLIAAGCDVNATDAFQRTPCHMLLYVDKAKAEGAMQSLALLIAAKANLNIGDQYGNTPLHHATLVGLCECMKMLLVAGANVQATNNRSLTPLHFPNDASAVGAIDAMSVLIDAKANVNQGDNVGDCPGHWAARHGRIENLKFLLARGARINLRNHAGKTMLFVAAEARRDDVVAVLLDAGAATNIRSASSVSPLELGLVHSVEIAARLLRAGASPHDVGADGWSTCHFAAQSPTHAVRSLRLLIDAGANVHAINDVGASVAHRAHASAFRFLHSHGVSLDAVDDNGNTPCHTVSDSAAVVALFALGARMTTKNNAGQTPFEAAVAAYASEDVLATFVATGICCGVQTQMEIFVLAEIVFAGGGLVSARLDGIALLTHDDDAITSIFERQKRLFRSRALEVCVGLQALGVSALELCQILSNMFAPLESVVPFDFAWRVVVGVKHFSSKVKQEQN